MTLQEPQFIRDDDGTILFALIDHASYLSLLRSSQQLKEAEAILKSYHQGQELPELIDGDIVHRLASGENPVRVWREYRGLKAIELAKATGISAAYLSEIETGKKDGTFKTMTGIANILNIRLDDLAPIQNTSDQRNHSQRIRLQAIKSHLKELSKLVQTDTSFDTAAVRHMAQKVKEQIEQLDMDNIEEDWLMNSYDTAQNILHLIEEAEQDFIHTAATSRDKLAKAMEGYAPNIASRDTSSIEDIFSKKQSPSSA